jgi:predicted TIM-barrel fold metal-dependent hydrolase
MFDMHVHVPDDYFYSVLSEEVIASSMQYFRGSFSKMDFEECEGIFEEQGVTAYALLPLPIKGFDPEPVYERFSAYLAKSAMAVGFAAVNPERDPLSLVRKALREGFAGVKLHPTLQEIYPWDQRLYPVYQALSEVDGVVVVHTGTSGIGAGMRAGGGFKLEYARPLHIDRVAAEFPNVNFVLAHFGWPWYEEAVAIALQKANVYIDLSGWSPKYIPEVIWKYAQGPLESRILFGSDFPFITPKRWVSDFAAVSLRDETKRKIMYENASSLFEP